MSGYVRLQGWVSIVQIVPDLWRSESVNVGVILLVPSAEFCECQMLGNLSRARSFFSGLSDGWVDDVVLGMICSFKDRVKYEKLKTLADLQNFADTRANWIRLTTPRGVCVEGASVNEACAACLGEMYDKSVQWEQ